MMLVKMVVAWSLESHEATAFDFLREVEKPLGRVLGLGEFHDRYDNSDATLIHVIDLIHVTKNRDDIAALMHRYDALQRYLLDSGPISALIEIREVNGVVLTYSTSSGPIPKSG